MKQYKNGDPLNFNRCVQYENMLLYKKYRCLLDF